MKSALTAPAVLGELDPRALGQAEVAALADHPAAQLVGVHADRVRGAVQRVGVALRRRLDDRADAAVPEQVDRRAQDRLDHLGGRQHVVGDVERHARLLGQLDPLGRARVDAAALGDQLASS